MQWIVLLLMIICLVIIIEIFIHLRYKKGFKKCFMKVVGLVVLSVIIGWYFTPYKLDLEIDKNSSISIPLKGGTVIYLDDEQKEELSKIVGGLYVKRELLNGYKSTTYDAYNLITVFFYSVSNATPNHSKSMAINLSLDEDGFKNIPNEEGFIEILSKGRILKIQETEELRAFIVQLIEEKNTIADNEIEEIL